MLFDIRVPLNPWFLYQMVAHFTMRTYGVNQAFRVVEGIWLHRGSRQIRDKKNLKIPIIIRAQHVLSYHLVSTMLGSFLTQPLWQSIVKPFLRPANHPSSI